MPPVPADPAAANDTALIDTPPRAVRRLAHRLWPDPDDIRETLIEIDATLRACGMARSTVALFTLALAEALNNVSEHAFSGQTRRDWITLDLDVAPDRIDLVIVDSGRAMPGLAPPKGDLPRLDVCLADLPEGDFGWYIIRQLAQRVAYARVSGRNRLELDFDLAGLDARF